MLKAKPLGLFAGAVVASLLVAGSPAGAVPITSPIVPRQGSNTEMTFTSLGPGQAVDGFVADPSNPFDPLTGYPTANPGTGFHCVG